MPYYEVTDDGVTLTPARLRRLVTRSDCEAYMAAVAQTSDAEALARCAARRKDEHGSIFRGSADI